MMYWIGVDYLRIAVMSLSRVWTLILTAPIHCRGSIGEQVMECNKSVQMKKQHRVLRVKKFSFLGELFF